MNIKVVINYVISEVPKVNECVVEVNEDTTIQELLCKAGCEVADLSGYYPLSGIFSFNEPWIPYLFIENRVVYEVLFKDAKVQDFLFTHHITDGTIKVETGHPQAGGPGICSLIDIWNDAYPVLEMVAVICTVTGFSLKSLFDYLRQHFLKKQQPPQTCFDILFSRKCWNAFELAALLDMETDRAKELLKLCDYQYDRKKMQYLQGKHTDEIKEKLMNIKVYDI